MTPAEIIQKALTRSHMSVRDLARRTGIKYRLLLNYRLKGDGISQMRLCELMAIARAAGLTEGELNEVLKGVRT